MTESSPAANPSARSTHRQISAFFRRPPEHWSITEYLSFPHPSTLTKRKILDGWKKGLQVIASCSASCCSDSHRLRAHDLITRYEVKGNGSDRHVGQTWLKNEKSSPAKETSQAVNYSFNYHGNVESAPIIHSQINTGSIANLDSATGKRKHSPEPESEGPVRKTRSYTRNRTQTQAAEQENGTPAQSDDDAESASELEPESESTSSSAVSTRQLAPSPSAAKNAFTRTFTAMRTSSQWRLSSGRTVESVVYSACFSLHDHSFATSVGQSFVIDLACPTMESWFAPEEWEEISSAMPSMPKADMAFVESLRRFFPVKTTGDLRRVLGQTSYLSEGEEYDREKHFDADWADTVIRSVLRLFEAPDEPLRAPHLEDWYTSYLWSPIIDQCLLSLPGMTIERKESICRATSTRKNRHRTLSKPPSRTASASTSATTSSTSTGNSTRPTPARLRSGPRLDGIIKTVEDNPFEYGGMEVARTFSGELTSTKYLTDGYKLVKTLRDMLYRLHELVEHDEAVIGDLQVVGVVNAGLALQVLRMAHPRGYVCLLSRERPVAVPTGVADLQALLRVLSEVARMKKVVQEARGLVAGRMKGEEMRFRELVEGTPEPVKRLFLAADTP